MRSIPGVIDKQRHPSLEGKSRRLDNTYNNSTMLGRIGQNLVDPGNNERASTRLQKREQPAGQHGRDITLGPHGENNGPNHGDKTGHDDKRPSHLYSVRGPCVHERKGNLRPVAGAGDDVDLLGGPPARVFEPEVEVGVDADAEDVDYEDGAVEIYGPGGHDALPDGDGELLHGSTAYLLHPLDGHLLISGLQPLGFGGLGRVGDGPVTVDADGDTNDT